MIRLLPIGALALCLTACGKPLPPVEYQRPPADVPDASLVTPCDTSEQPIVTNGDLATELNHTRRQRDDCASRMDGVRKWRGDAIRRATVTP